MSWQRILELARRRKLPLIVTDIGGRESMVVLPLEEYEELVERTGLTATKAVSSLSENIPNIRLEPIQETDVNDEKIAEKAQQEAQRQIDTALKDLTEMEAPIGDGLTLEERFYLEPVDEE